MAMAGRTFDLKTKSDWQKLYREWVGVPEAERDLVFQPFYRALGTEADGSGLGLPIVLEIALQHQAQVTLEPAHPGRAMPGARFSVRFTSLT